MRQTLLNSLCKISSPDEMERVLSCLLTAREIREIENRLRIFTLLERHIPQREIATQLGVGIATVTRGARAFNNGEFTVLKPYLKPAEQ